MTNLIDSFFIKIGVKSDDLKTLRHRGYLYSGLVVLISLQITALLAIFRNIL